MTEICTKLTLYVYVYYIYKVLWEYSTGIHVSSDQNRKQLSESHKLSMSTCDFVHFPLHHLSQQGEVGAAFKARERLALLASPIMGRKWLRVAKDIGLQQPPEGEGHACQKDPKQKSYQPTYALNSVDQSKPKQKRYNTKSIHSIIVSYNIIHIQCIHQHAERKEDF